MRLRGKLIYVNFLIIRMLFSFSAKLGRIVLSSTYKFNNNNKLKTLELNKVIQTAIIVLSCPTLGYILGLNEKSHIAASSQQMKLVKFDSFEFQRNIHKNKLACLDLFAGHID